MDLLRAFLVYFSLVYLAAVESAPVPSATPAVSPTPTAIISVSPTPGAVIDLTPNPGYRTLRTGNSGEEVRSLQRQLMYYGYYTGELDGRYGNQTRQAVERFQYMHGLNADGIAGKQTLTVLYESNAVIFAAPTSVPEKTTAPEISVVASPEPTLTPSSVSTPVPAPQSSPTPVSSATDVPTAPALEEIEMLPSCTLLFTSWGESTSNTQAQSSVTPLRQNGTLYLPLKAILSPMGINVIENTTGSLYEIAFAQNESIIRLSCTLPESSSELNAEVWRDEQKLTPSQNDFVFVDSELYCSESLLEKLLQVSFVYSSEEHTLQLRPLTEAEG